MSTTSLKAYTFGQYTIRVDIFISTNVTRKENFRQMSGRPLSVKAGLGRRNSGTIVTHVKPTYMMDITVDLSPTGQPPSLVLDNTVCAMNQWR